MSTYNYTRLTPETENIRLLTLLPGAFDDEIRITLHTALMIDRYNPAYEAYEALSYTWGSADNPVNIVVGRSGDTTFSVTENLATALRYLRAEGRERVLFIEAICVNQRDVRERRLLVDSMAEIYGNARRVVIWLGPPEDDSTWGLLAIHEMTAHIDVNWETRTLQPQAYAQVDARWADPAENPNYNNRGWTPILKLLQRPWFYCLWNWQELRLAKSADVLCGYDYLPWTRLRNMAFCLHLKHKRSDRSSKEVDMAVCIAQVYQICAGPPLGVRGVPL